MSRSEIWVDINGYEGSYMVSNTGKVRSLNKQFPIKDYELKPHDNGKGYKIVGLSKPGEKIKNHYIHRLVASAFIKNEFLKPQVNHKDGNKGNNNVENLEWVTLSENIRHSCDTGLYVIKDEHFKKLKTAGVIALSKPVMNIETGIMYKNLLSAASSLGLHRVTFQRRFRNGKEKRFVRVKHEEYNKWAEDNGHFISRFKDESKED